ncbi:MAG: hypothetical protein Q7Q71_14480 [Verrucomicrobiota bacterium JB023]|nr:hypothetical protein [Verrucomicrobiota bacterium JB023]
MILLTGFLPFRGRSENGSRLLAGSFDGHCIGSTPIHVEILPVIWKGHRERLDELAARYQPELILSLGEGQPDRIRFENVGRNLARGHDEEGREPDESFLLREGPDTLQTPLRKPDITPERWPLVETEDAGGYLCNATLFLNLWAGRRAGFLHLPILAEHDREAYLSALRPVVEAVLQHNLAETEGQSMLA